MNGTVDPQLLKETVNKIQRSRLPSAIQGMVLVLARLIVINPAEMINFLIGFSLEGKMALKVLIDKWLHNQPLFRGTLT